MTDTIHITGQAILSCSCGEDLFQASFANVELHDLTDHLERKAELYGWGTNGNCPACQAPLDADQAEVESADNERKTEQAQ